MMQMVEFQFFAVVAWLVFKTSDFSCGLSFFETIIQSVYKMPDLQ